uniref:Uncharacterized protein n=1 Tax=Opuntia streptacantha TaxID=393608 RepID=A0A7C9EKJ7_OPUST
MLDGICSVAPLSFHISLGILHRSCSLFSGQTQSEVTLKPRLKSCPTFPTSKRLKEPPIPPVNRPSVLYRPTGVSILVCTTVNAASPSLSKSWYFQTFGCEASFFVYSSLKLHFRLLKLIILPHSSLWWSSLELPVSLLDKRWAWMGWEGGV